MFQFRRFPTHDYLIHHALTEVCSAGFPHSVISGSMLICSSPKLFAAYHDLHRLLMPRHSPCALLRLTSPSLCRFRFHSTVSSSNFRKVHIGSLNCWIMQTHLFYQQNCNYPFFRKLSACSFNVPYCCLLIICIIISQCSVFKVQTRGFFTSSENGGPKWILFRLDYASLRSA